jgi:cytoskeletal protein CcmA (bactofilin family)
MPGSQVSNESDLMRRIADIERQYRELAAANPLATAGITVQPNGITIGGSETVTGDLNVSGTETVSGNLNVTGTQAVSGNLNVSGPINASGNSTFGGNMVINGNLSVPNGSISNSALMAPVVISTSGVSQNNYGVPLSAGTSFANTTVSVPSGYSTADVLCMVVAGAFNGTTSGDYLYVASDINGQPGGETPQFAGPNGGYASAAANGIRTLTGLNGGSISLGCQVRAGGGWGANSSNFANMNAVIFFRR